LVEFNRLSNAKTLLQVLKKKEAELVPDLLNALEVVQFLVSFLAVAFKPFKQV
jgi:hypothetical protein